MIKKRELVNEIVSVILKSVDPYKKTLEYLKKVEKPHGKVFMIAFGKSSLKMAKAALEVFEIEKGVVVTNEEIKEYQNSKITYIKGGHPLPNENSVRGAEMAIKLLKSASERDLILVMISGGGSALFESPKIELDELKHITDRLIKGGANIKELNIVRKSLSKVKGGKLPIYTKAKVLSFVMSDVIGNDLSTIASGPTYYENIEPREVFEILTKYGIEITDKLKKVIREESSFDAKNVEHILVATNKDACEAVKNFMQEKGYNTIYMGSSIQGESREVAKVLGGLYIDSYSRVNDFSPPIAVVSGGESTVTVNGKGMGGRNQEMCLALAPLISDKDITFFSFGTDGIDGYSPAAGAMIDGTTLKRAEALNLNYMKFLDDNNSYNFFKALSDLIITGPTGTNVMDVQVAIVD